MKTRNIVTMGTAAIAGIVAIATRPTTKVATTTHDVEYEVNMLELLARDICFLRRAEMPAEAEGGHAYSIARYAALAMHERYAQLVEEGASNHTIIRLTEAIADLNEVQGFPRYGTDQNENRVPYRPTTSG